MGQELKQQLLRLRLPLRKGGDENRAEVRNCCVKAVPLCLWHPRLGAGLRAEGGRNKTFTSM